MMSSFKAAEAERMRARANACNVNEIRKALDEKEKQVASMLTERDMQQDEMVQLSGQILGKQYTLVNTEYLRKLFRTDKQNKRT